MELVVIPIEELRKMIVGIVKHEVTIAFKEYKSLFQQEEKLLSIAETAIFFHVSRPTIYRWIKLGILPINRINKRVYFLESEIIKSLKNIQRMPN